MLPGVYEKPSKAKEVMATIGASLGSAYSFLMRIELGIPGYVLLEKNFHDYNV